MEVETRIEQVSIGFTRLIVVAAVLFGGYLLFKGANLLQRLFGVVLVWVGGFFLLHHHMVWSRSRRNGERDG